MTLDPTKLRVTAPDPAAVRRDGPAERPGLMARASDAVDEALSPLDHLKDELAGDLAKAAREAEARTEDVPVFGALVQFFNGAAAAGLGVVEGTYESIRHPVSTVKGLWTMSTHVPLTPGWLVRAVSEGPAETLAGDGQFWKAVGVGMIDPYRKDWQAGRYYAVAGRAAFDIGTIVVGVKNAKNAIDSWRASRATAGAVDDVARLHPELVADDGLRAAAVGTEARVTGQVMGEGTTVIDSVAGKGKAVRRASTAKPKLKLAGTFDQLDESQLTRVKLDVEAYRKLKQVGPQRLMSDTSVRSRFRKLTRSVDTRMDDTLERVVGIRPQGKPKMPDRAAAKLARWQAESGPSVRLSALDDLARGRIDLPSYDPAQLRDVFRNIREHFGDQNLTVHNYVRNPKPFYRGRLHVKIRDKSGLWYELQIGPRQLSEFYDTPFKVGNKALNIHDAVYKGVLMLDDDAVKLLGKGSLRDGHERIARVLDTYARDLKDVISVARDGGDIGYATRTAPLRQQITELLKELPRERWPVDLR